MKTLRVNGLGLPAAVRCNCIFLVWTVHLSLHPEKEGFDSNGS